MRLMSKREFTNRQWCGIAIIILLTMVAKMPVGSAVVIGQLYVFTEVVYYSLVASEKTNENP